MKLNWIRKLFRNPAIEKILLRFTVDSTEGSFFYKATPMPELYNQNNSLRTIKRNGIFYNLDLSDLMDWWFYWGFFDEGHNFLFNKINTDDVFIDVGANKGILSSHISTKLNHIGKVIAFEANPDNYALCKQLSQNNPQKLQQVEFIPKGCGAAKAKMAISRSSHFNTGMDRLVSITDKNTKFVEVVTLDEELINCDRIDFIKIDTEGFELNVLKGATKTIERFKPKLFIELDKNNLARYNSTVENILELLRPHGYSFFNVQGGFHFGAESDLDHDFHFDCYCEV